ncbi:MAG: hypothetical protein LBH25_01695 [Fibromonadaceae bacterium]|jgi:flagellar basal-body rod modification protein FlgD|nr:hypothetical protein [Fibromonadaceae bacterium]
MSTIGNTYYDSIGSLMNPDSSVRKVAANKDGGEYIVNQGDTKSFSTSGSDMGKDQFLKLLVAQLQHQDPMNPAEDTQFVAQLAQFSQLEFTQNSSQAISSLATSMQAFMDMQTLQAQSITNASATPLLGKSVRVMETSFNHSGFEDHEFNVHLNEGTRQAKIRITDEDGNLVTEMAVSADNSKGGDYTVKWDSINPETGNKYLGGKFDVEVVDASGSKIAGYIYQEGIVSGVNFSANGAALTINGKQYGLGYLVQVEDEEPQQQTASSSEDENKSTGGYG